MKPLWLNTETVPIHQFCIGCELCQNIWHVTSCPWTVNGALLQTVVRTVTHIKGQLATHLPPESSGQFHQINWGCCYNFSSWCRLNLRAQRAEMRSRLTLGPGNPVSPLSPVSPYVKGIFENRYDVWQYIR